MRHLGPAARKTATRAIPTLLAAPAAAFATSNKPDLYAATRLVREQSGEIWNFDPEQLAGGEPSWWWDPLSYVTSDRRALELTDAFVGAYRDPDARPDPFFDPAGQELVANLLQAAALDNRPITQALWWSTRPTDDEPAQILKEHGLELAAASVLDHVHSPFEQRGGVFGTARQILVVPARPRHHPVGHPSLTNRTPRPARPRRVRAEHRHALPALKGRAGSSAGLVTALAMALCDAAEQHAKHSPGGRLAVPLVGVLDEAANICRWRQLPDLYSHYGSRGICLLTLLQSWSQGVQVWGPNGMRKLWGAANIRVYGGGVGEPDFLSNLEKLIGEYNRVVASPSHQRTRTGTSPSTSWQLTPTPILTVAELAALPRDRAVVLPSGAPAVLAQPIPWWNTKSAAAIRTSIERYDPAAPSGNTQGEPMDHDHLTDEATAGALPGLEPLVKRAVVEALKQHAAGVTAAAVARGLADQDLASIAERAVERELDDLAEPAGPYYPTLPEWVEQWLLPLYRRSLTATTASGAPNGGATTKRSPDSTRSGAPGNTSDSTPPPGSRSGFATTPTTT